MKNETASSSNAFDEIREILIKDFYVSLKAFIQIWVTSVMFTNDDRTSKLQHRFQEKKTFALTEFEPMTFSC